MALAILQSNLEIPPVEILKKAFRSVTCLTDLDAHTLAGDAYGILVRRLSAKDAVTLQGALRAEGIETELVPENQLPALPAARMVHRLDCLEDHLLVYDPLGRSFPLAWNHILLIAAGQVRLTDFERVRKEKPVTRIDPAGHAYTLTEIEYSTREQRNDHLLLEIVLSGAVLRYIANARKFNYQYLGDRRSRDPLANFTCLIQDLTRHAPQAALNRGAYYLREQVATPFAYPSRNAFYEEMIWLLWRLQQQPGE